MESIKYKNVDGIMLIPSSASVLENGPEKELLALIGGATPETEDQKQMVKEIESIKKGQFIGIPSSV